MAMQNPDRKVLYDFLLRKGFSFAEDVDLAQLDRAHRKLTDLEVIPAAKPKKKRRPDILRILDGEDLSDIVDGDQESGGLSTAAKRQNYEQAMLAKASWAKEAAEWEQQFQLKRNDLDEAQNLRFKESFIQRTKKKYSKIDHEIRQKQQSMDNAGVFDPAWNAVRAESKKRVLLAKELRYSEICRAAATSALSRPLAEATTQSIVDDGDAAARSSHPWTEGDRPHGAAAPPKEPTLRARRKEAMAQHMSRHASKEHPSGSITERGRATDRSHGGGPCRLPDISSGGCAARAGPTTRFAAAAGTGPRGRAGASVPRGGGPGDDGWVPGGGRRRSAHGLLSAAGGWKGGARGSAPLPPAEVLEVEDLFAARRSAMRAEFRAAGERLATEIREVDAAIASVAARGLSGSGGGGGGGDGGSDYDDEEDDEEKGGIEGGGAVVAAARPSAGARVDEPESPAPGGAARARASDARGTERGAAAAAAAAASTEPGAGGLAMGAHLHIRPEIRPAGAAHLPPLSGPALYSLLEVADLPVAPATATLEGEGEAAGDAGVAPAAKGTPRRTRYLRPSTEGAVLPPQAQSLQSLVGAAGRLTEIPGPRTLNPFYTTFSSSSDVMLQAARSRLTPRIATASSEEAMRPTQPARALLEPAYRPDHELLRLGTPDLEERLKKEMTGLSLSLPMPALAGDVDILKLVGPGRQQRPSALFGPVPTVSKRGKAPKKGAKAVAVAEEGLEAVGADADDGSAGLARALMMEENARLARNVSIPESDQKMMREEHADGQPPAPLDADMAQRLESIWEALEMPLKEKLGILVKYSAIQNTQYLLKLIEAWEEAVNAVRIREQALMKLAHHIRTEDENQSDLFLREQVSKSTSQCALVATKLLMEFGDILTFRGMPYTEELDGSIEDSLERLMEIERKRTGGRRT